MLAALCASMLAGIAILPDVVALGFEPMAGPSLLSISIPAVLISMPSGGFFMVLFRPDPRRGPGCSLSVVAGRWDWPCHRPRPSEWHWRGRSSRCNILAIAIAREEAPC